MTLSEKHSRHSHLVKPHAGQFHRHEWSIVGTTCEEARQLAVHMAEALGSQWRLGYVDADHKGKAGDIALDGLLPKNLFMEITDKLHHYQFSYAHPPSGVVMRSLLSALDAVLVNGNHFEASGQIVVIDSRKDLQKKLDKLTNVRLVLLAGEQHMTSGIRELVPDGTPEFSLKDTEKIAGWLHGELVRSLPKVKALVLAGGKSQRMHTDKGLINYHGKPQREYLCGLLGDMGLDPHLSLRSEQAPGVTGNANCVFDRFLGLGPYGAILSALMHDPNAAWLTIACDLPLLGAEHIQELVRQRNASKIATAYHNPAMGFPEPLITLWEPRAYPVLLQFLAQGYSCPRKVLINSDIELINAVDTGFMVNANTPEEKEQAGRLIASAGSDGAAF